MQQKRVRSDDHQASTSRPFSLCCLRSSVRRWHGRRQSMRVLGPSSITFPCCSTARQMTSYSAVVDECEGKDQCISDPQWSFILWAGVAGVMFLRTAKALLVDTCLSWFVASVSVSFLILVRALRQYEVPDEVRMARGCAVTDDWDKACPWTFVMKVLREYNKT